MNVLSIIKYLFTLVGIGMLAGAFYLYGSTRDFLAEAATADATVVELARSRSSDSTTYKPVVQFTSRDGQAIEFISSTGSNPPSYSRGEKVEVLYRPDDPQDARINGFFSLWGGALIVAGLGVVFFLVGGGLLLAAVVKRRNNAYLKHNGTRIVTDYTGVELNTSLRVNGRHPYRVLSQWQNPSTSEIHVFESDNLWFDPEDYIKSDKITVLIDRNNPKKYFVDLSFLPKLAK